MDSGNGKGECLSVEMKIGAWNADCALIGAVESASNSARGVDLEMQLDVQGAEDSCVVSSDGWLLLR